MVGGAIPLHYSTVSSVGRCIGIADSRKELIMESNKYCIPEAEREKVEKLIKRYQKKAAKYGATLNAEFGEPYAKEVRIYGDDYVNNECYEIGVQTFEVFDLTIESDTIKAGEYEVVACIEHLDGGNIVSLANEIKPEWTTMPARCEHCGGNHGQRKTFIVRHKDGTEKQVGRTCLKEYCGIDPQRIGLLNSLGDELDLLDEQNYNFVRSGIPVAYDIKDALTYAFDILTKQGYRKSEMPNSNKERLGEAMQHPYEVADKVKAEAEAMFKAVKAMSKDEAFKADLVNIKSLVDSGYCKASNFGFVAYAPVAYNKYIKRCEELKQREADAAIERESSEYVGEVGERLTIKTKTVKILTSWETQYGTTWLYKIVDEQNNVYVWFASSPFFEREALVTEIKATVKDHNERDGVKQTVLTRCKVTKTKEKKNV